MAPVGRRFDLVINPVISHERGKDREAFTTSGTYPWLFVTQIFHNGQPSHGGDRKLPLVVINITPFKEASLIINKDKTSSQHLVRISRCFEIVPCMALRSVAGVQYNCDKRR